MTPTIRVGTSGYNYPEWRGTFYPVGMKPAAMLPYYAERFDTVEINATFYRMPTPAALDGWAQATPPGFVFSLKVPQRITHMRRLNAVEEPLGSFCDLSRRLGARLGPLFFQLPPNFRKDAGRLRNVLELVPRELRCAFEFRHASWFADDVYEALRGRDAALCVADTEEGHTPDEATATWGYYRLRAVEYTDAELARWADALRRSGRHHVYCYFKHEDTGTGPTLARRLLRRLAETP